MHPEIIMKLGYCIILCIGIIFVFVMWFLSETPNNKKTNNKKEKQNGHN